MLLIALFANCPHLTVQVMQEGDAVRLTFERAALDGDPPYWVEATGGDETQEALVMRTAIKEDARVREVLERFWRVLVKDENGRIGKEEYLKAHTKIGLALVPDVTYEEAAASGEQDWVEDAHGASSMEKSDFDTSLFQLADMWCDSISADKYARFLRRLFRLITVKFATNRTGRVTVHPPPPPPATQKSSWERFRDARRLRLGMEPLAPPPPPADPPALAEGGEAAAAGEAAEADGGEAADGAEPPPAEMSGEEAPEAEGSGEEQAAAAEATPSAVEDSAEAQLDSADPELDGEDEVGVGADEEGVTVQYGWVDDGEVVPMVLYEPHAAIEWAEDFDAGAPPAASSKASAKKKPPSGDSAGGVEGRPAPPPLVTRRSSVGNALHSAALVPRAPLVRKSSIAPPPKRSELAEIAAEIAIADGGDGGGRPVTATVSRPQAPPTRLQTAPAIDGGGSRPFTAASKASAVDESSVERATTAAPTVGVEAAPAAAPVAAPTTDVTDHDASSAAPGSTAPDAAPPAPLMSYTEAVRTAQLSEALHAAAESTKPDLVTRVSHLQPAKTDGAKRSIYTMLREAHRGSKKFVPYRSAAAEAAAAEASTVVSPARAAATASAEASAAVAESAAAVDGEAAAEGAAGAVTAGAVTADAPIVPAAPLDAASKLLNADPCGELASEVLAALAVASPAPRVHLTGAPIAAETLGAPLAKALNATLVTPKAAVEAAVAAGEADAAAAGLAAAVASGSEILPEMQEGAMQWMLGTPAVTVKGAVMVGVPHHIASASAHSATQTLALMVEASELSARLQAAEEAANAPPPLSDGPAAEEAAEPEPEAEGEEGVEPPAPPPPPLVLAPLPALWTTTDDCKAAAALPRAKRVQGALPPAALLEAALTALGQPLARPDAYAVALPEEPPEQPAEKLTALLDAATAAYVDAAAAAVPPAAEGDELAEPRPVPPVVLSNWGLSCPVTLKEGGGYPAPGSYECAARYRGRLYLLANEEKLATFLARPEESISAPPGGAAGGSPGGQQAHVAVLGPPLSGRSAVAAALAKSRNALRVSLATLPSLLATRAGQLGKALAPEVSRALEGAKGAKLEPKLLAAAVGLLAGHAPMPKADDAAKARAAILTRLVPPPPPPDAPPPDTPADDEPPPLADAPAAPPASAGPPTAKSILTAMASAGGELAAELFEHLGYAWGAAALSTIGALAQAVGDDAPPLEVAGFAGYPAEGAEGTEEAMQTAGVAAANALLAACELAAATPSMGAQLSARDLKRSLGVLLVPAEPPEPAPTLPPPQSLVLDGLPADVASLNALAFKAGVMPIACMALGDENLERDALSNKLQDLLASGPEAAPVDDTGRPLAQAGLDKAVDRYVGAFAELSAAFAQFGVTVRVLPLDAPFSVGTTLSDPFAASASPAEPVEEVAALPPYGVGALGSTGEYCPYALATLGRLVKGRPDQAVNAQGRIFLCSSETATAAVVAAPGAFISNLDGVSPPPAPPPPFLIVAGPIGSHREEQVARLAEARKLPVLSLRALLDANPVPPPPPKPQPPPGEEGEEEAPEEEEEPPRTTHTPEEVATHIAAALRQPPHAVGGCLLDWSNSKGILFDSVMWEALQAEQLVPDAVVTLELSDEDAVKRLFKPTDRPTLKDAEKAVRKQKCLEYLQEKAEAEEDPEGPLHELLASEDQEAIGAAAAKYMSKFEYIDRSETLAQQATMEEEADAADAEQTSSLETANQQTKEALDSLAEALEAALVPCFNIQASLRPGQLQREIRSALEPWLSRRTSLFARAVPVEPAEAAAMLAEGSCTLSRFGLHDPVLYVSSNGAMLSPPLLPTPESVSPPPKPSDEELVDAEAAVASLDAADASEEATAARTKLQAVRAAVFGPEPEGIFSARLDERLFVFTSRSRRDAFIAAPNAYALAAPPPPHVVPRACVLGPAPAASALAAALAAKTRALLVSVKSAAAWAELAGTHAGAAASAKLASGGSLDDELLATLLVQRLGAPDALAAGWILDGLPHTPQLASALDAAGLRPMRLYDCVAEDAAADTAAATAGTAAPNSEYAKRGIVVRIDARRNSWAQATTALNDLNAVMTQRQRHAVATAAGEAAAISDLGLTIEEFAAKLTPTHGTFCPVSWARKRRLRRRLPEQLEADPRADLNFAAEYRGRYYSCAGAAELTAFLVRPTEAICTRALPKDVPTPVAPAAASEAGEPALQGYCPVSLGRGPKGVDYDSRVASLRKGTETLAVEYQGKPYLCFDARCRAEFLERPWRYSEQANPLPAKLPPSAVELIIANLPIRGYIEQTMGDLLTECLTLLAELRPIYPTLDQRESALKFVSLYIRAHNSKRRPAHLKAKFESSYLDYKDCCAAADKLIQFQKAGGSKAGGEVPEDLDRMNEMWDSIQKRDVKAFF